MQPESGLPTRSGAEESELDKLRWMLMWPAKSSVRMTAQETRVVSGENEDQRVVHENVQMSNMLSDLYGLSKRS